MSSQGVRLVNALCWAINDIARLNKVWLQRSPHYTARTHNMALCECIEKGYVRVMKLLLERAPDIPGGGDDDNDLLIDPLRISAEYGKPETMQLVLAQGKKNPWYIRNIIRVTEWTIFTQKPDKLKLLLEYGVDIRDVCNGRTVAACASIGDFELLKLLLNCGKSIDATEKGNALCWGRNLSVTLLLLIHGARLTAQHLLCPYPCSFLLALYFPEHAHNSSGDFYPGSRWFDSCPRRRATLEELCRRRLLLSVFIAIGASHRPIHDLNEVITVYNQIVEYSALQIPSCIKPALHA
jgi:hypothetical protein